MKLNWRGIGLGLLFSIALAILGGLVGFQFAGLLRDERFARWRDLGAPPGGADHFVSLLMDSGRTLNVGVATAAGETYQRNTGREEEWAAFTPLNSANIGECAISQVEQTPAYARWRGLIRACIAINWSWEWTSDTDELVILQDGSVWIWRNYHPFSDLLIFVCYAPLGFLLLGWLVRILVKRRTVRKPQPVQT